LPPLVSAALEPGATRVAARIERLRTQRAGAARYTVLGEVAEGGMGKVLRVWDELLAREVAMKIVPSSPPAGASEEQEADHEQRLARFLDEARIMAQLDHPGIVPVHEIGLDETGAVFFTMPLVRGQDLKQVFALVRRGAEGWSVPRAVAVVHAVCRTVAFAHAKGVVHRDLKPENIMVGPFGESYVMDWGLALLLGRSEREAIVGTPAYMAPEQVRAQSGTVGPRADVYSLGAILYELFARRVPHEASLQAGPTAPGTLERVLARPPRRLSELRDDVPADLAAICAKAMASVPEARYASALEMAADLEAWLAGRVVSALEAGRWTRFRKWRGRNLRLALAVDALVALVLVSGAGFLFQQHVLLREVRAKNAEARASAYASGLYAAELGLRAHETGEARRRLEACEPDRRGWEWRHLALRADPSVRTLAHGGSIWCVAASPDGGTLAAGGDDGMVRLWDRADGRERATLGGHTRLVNEVAFSPDGKRLATASDDHTVRLWDPVTGSLVNVVSAHATEVEAVAFSPDGTVLASSDKDGVLVLSRTVDALPLESEKLSSRDLIALAYLAGSGELVTADLVGHVRVFGPSELELRREARVTLRSIEALAVDPTGAWVAVAFDRSAVVLDARDLSIAHTFDTHLRPVTGVAFDPTGSRLATTSYDNALRLFELASGRADTQLDGHEDCVRGVAFLPDGRSLVTGSEDGTVRLWDLARLPITPALELDKWVTSLAFSPDGSQLAVGGQDGWLRVLASASGAELQARDVERPIDAVAWGARDELAFGSGERETWLASPTLEAVRGLAGAEGFPVCLRFDRSGERLYVRDSRGRIGIHDQRSERWLVTLITDDEGRTLALAPDERRFVAGTEGGSVLVFDARSFEPLATWPALGSAVSALAFAPDGRYLAVGLIDGTIAWLDAGDGTLAARLEGHKSIVSSLAFHPDGTRLVSGSYDHTLRVWSPAETEVLLVLQGHTAAVTGVAFDPRGEVLASASKDGTLRLWRATDTLPPAR
jgi:WD40 repeat protein